MKGYLGKKMVTLYPQHMPICCRSALDEIHKKITLIEKNISRMHEGNISSISDEEVLEEIKSTKTQFQAGKTNALGVTKIIEDYRVAGYSYPKDTWPYDDLLVWKKLEQVITSKEKRIIAFWLQIESLGKTPLNFINYLHGQILFWRHYKFNYEGSFSQKIEQVRRFLHELQKMKSLLKNSDFVSSQITDVITNMMDKRMLDVFEEENPLWNMWDDRQMKLEHIIDESITRLEQIISDKKVAWYPKKVRSISADRVFLMRAILKVASSLSLQVPHVVIADMVNIILDETITEEDVRKNL